MLFLYRRAIVWYNGYVCVYDVYSRIHNLEPLILHFDVCLASVFGSNWTCDHFVNVNAFNMVNCKYKDYISLIIIQFLIVLTTQLFNKFHITLCFIEFFSKLVTLKCLIFLSHGFTSTGIR